MTAVSGHFGEWLQGRLAGQIVLVTMACPALQVRVAGDAALFPKAELSRFCNLLGLRGPVPGVQPDMPPGGGAGASTASLVAVARALGFEGSAQELANACLAIEGACDPLMFDTPDAILWASRGGQVLRQLPQPPLAEVVGGFWGAPQRTDPLDMGFADVSDLVEAWQHAVSSGDLPAAARVATGSAVRCDAQRGPATPLAALAADLGALGVVRAHTGSARGLIFAPGTVPDRAEAALREAGFSDVLRFMTGGTVA